MTTAERLAARYGRIEEQLRDLYAKVGDPIARMASAATLLQYKMPHFFWTGFYRLVEGDLIAGPYQGPLACMMLEKNQGVCWAAVDRNEPMLVGDVHAFPGHIACDPRSRSEVVIPVRDGSGVTVAVLDVDSDKIDAFSEVDVSGLTAIAELIFCAPLDAQSD